MVPGAAPSKCRVSSACRCTRLSALFSWGGSTDVQEGRISLFGARGEGRGILIMGYLRNQRPLAILKLYGIAYFGSEDIETS